MQAVEHGGAAARGKSETKEKAVYCFMAKDEVKTNLGEQRMHLLSL